MEILENFDDSSIITWLSGILDLDNFYFTALRDLLGLFLFKIFSNDSSFMNFSCTKTFWGKPFIFKNCFLSSIFYQLIRKSSRFGAILYFHFSFLTLKFFLRILSLHSFVQSATWVSKIYYEWCIITRDL